MLPSLEDLSLPPQLLLSTTSLDLEEPLTFKTSNSMELSLHQTATLTNQVELSLERLSLLILLCPFKSTKLNASHPLLLLRSKFD